MKHKLATNDAINKMQYYLSVLNVSHGLSAKTVKLPLGFYKRDLLCTYLV